MAILLILLGIAGFIYLIYKAALFNTPKPSPEALDLNSVRDALMEKQGWSLERADAARTEYLRFLTLLQLKPGFMLVPWSTAAGQDDLDQFWHQHILDTARYAADCNLLFGRMIHHNPHVVRGSGQESDAVAKTQRLYTRTFQSSPNGQPADALFLTGCSTCAAEDGHSHSPSHSHSDHSGDAGHSDGGSGHSCGGHGCGHGCGGH